MVNDYVNILSGEAICLTLLKERRETVETWGMYLPGNIRGGQQRHIRGGVAADRSVTYVQG
jgi:hypothetical protein